VAKEEDSQAQISKTSRENPLAKEAEEVTHTYRSLVEKGRDEHNSLPGQQGSTLLPSLAARARARIRLKPDEAE
jgi:hypothetical protein